MPSQSTYSREVSGSARPVSAPAAVRLAGFTTLLTLLVLINAPTHTDAENETTAPPTFARVGVWEPREGYIAHITFFDDERLWMYLTNPEGAAIWELIANNPSKRKVVLGRFLEGTLDSPAWLTNVDILLSPGRNYLVIWPLLPEGKKPSCLLICLSEGEPDEIVSLRLPPGFGVLQAAFSRDDRYLALARHPLSTAGEDIAIFDLESEKSLGELEPKAFKPPSAPGLISAIAFDDSEDALWVLAGIFRGEVYSPPLLARVPIIRGEDTPWIQGNALRNGLIPVEGGVLILLDPDLASSGAGLEPSNFWKLDTESRLLTRPISAEGFFSAVSRDYGDYRAAVFAPRSGDGKLLEARLELITAGGARESLVSTPRLVAFSPSGKSIAAVREGTNSLEVFSLVEDKTEDGENES